MAATLLAFSVACFNKWHKWSPALIEYLWRSNMPADIQQHGGIVFSVVALACWFWHINQTTAVLEQSLTEPGVWQCCVYLLIAHPLHFNCDFTLPCGLSFHSECKQSSLYFIHAETELRICPCALMNRNFTSAHWI